MRTLIFAAIVAALSGCSSHSEANRALDAAGYTDIDITGYRFFGCDEKDAWHTGFEATGQNGRRISGVVCSGLFKGATIRVD